MGTHPIFESDFDCLTEDACVSDRIEEWQNIRKTAESPTPAANMSKNTGTLYDHNVYQKQEYKVEKPQLSPSTREKRQKRFSGENISFLYKRNMPKPRSTSDRGR